MLVFLGDAMRDASTSLANGGENLLVGFVGTETTRSTNSLLGVVCLVWLVALHFDPGHT
jgi:hypothetical protein